MFTSNWPSFDELKKIAEEDPEALERFRQQQVNAIIESAPEHTQRRLRGIQFQVNCRRRLHKSALGSCISISKMMQESVQQLNEALNGSPIEKQVKRDATPLAKTGRILSFPSPAEDQISTS
ncbi:MAG: DUF3135 domain-containing protein [Cellvibrionaceae bacterium]|nr:DUF3135 domain-containing protein [Cellvibrionaceae bacterium]